MKLIVILLLLIPSFGLTQEVKKEKVIKLKEMVVIAPKKKELEHVPGTTAVITKEEIRIRNVPNPAKALQQIPGIYIRMGKGPIANQQQINIRGMSEYRCQILRDGHRMNSSFYASMKSWNQISVEDICFRWSYKHHHKDAKETAVFYKDSLWNRWSVG